MPKTDAHPRKPLESTSLVEDTTGYKYSNELTFPISTKSYAYPLSLAPSLDRRNVEFLRLPML